jgi:phosphatidylinositol glycan class B
MTFNFCRQRLRRTVRRTLIFAAFACVIRPTNVVIWVYLFPVLLWRLRHHVAIIQGISVDAASIGYLAAFEETTSKLMMCSRILFLGLLFTLDSLYFQKPTLTPLNFLLVNMSSVSLFYGSSPWHYYISQGIPILCTTALPFVLHGFWLATVRKAGVPSLSILAGCVIWTTCVYSTAGHKEWRFLHPLLPMLHVLAAKSLVDLAQLKSTHSDGSPTRSTPTYTWSHRPPIRPSHMCALLLSIPASIYVSMLFCDGPIGAVEYLRRTPSSEELSHGSIGFLMPCHSTPWQAYMHRAELSDHGRLWALQCEPPLEYARLLKRESIIA